MEAYLDKLGLIIITLSWVIQIAHMMRNKNKNISFFFVLLFLIGTIIMSYDQYMMGIKELFALNLINIVTTIFILILLLK